MSDYTNFTLQCDTSCRDHKYGNSYTYVAYREHAVLESTIQLFFSGELKHGNLLHCHLTCMHTTFTYVLYVLINTSFVYMLDSLK
jgi:hypothetical protein